MGTFRVRGLQEYFYGNTIRAFHLIHPPSTGHGWVVTEAILPWIMEGKVQLTKDMALSDRQSKERVRNRISSAF